MKNKTLAVVMATYDDFHGVYFTVHSLLLYHGDAVDKIIVLDNNPTSKHGEMTKNFIGNLGNPNVKYMELTGINSTALTRDTAIRSATSDVVICIDPHVLLPFGAVRTVRNYFEATDSKDLIQGPLQYDNGKQISTHFNFDNWSGEMWGTWDTDPRGFGNEPFEIPGNGLGMFATQREHWLGFNAEFRGFGGEEGYVHEKYRKAGRKVICLPQARWVHRFGRPDGAPYPLTFIDKARNYAIGFRELGLDLSPIRKHFVDELKKIDPLDWKAIENGEYPKPRTCQSCVGEAFDTIDEWFDLVKSKASDINEHATTLRELATGRTVADYGHRPECSSVALASTASGYTLLHPAQPREFAHIAKFLGSKKVPVNHQVVKEEIPTVPKCDLLFIDTVHTYDYTKRFLAANHEQVRDYIVLHDTVIYGETGEDGKKPGMMGAIREFLREHRRWSVKQHHHHQYGLIVLVGNDSLKPKLPGMIRQASNFAKAVAKHVANGANKVSLEIYESRLAKCDECPSRLNDRCTECGCFLEEKASWETSECPLEHWSRPSVQPTVASPSSVT
jgi:hypothetical protein